MAVNLELLEELVAFKRYGTLMATAEHLMITQPTVTRGMKKLEDELGVTLFDRSVKNHLVLTATGELAASEAARLLQHVSDFEEKVLNFDHYQNEFTVSSTLPGPLLLLNEKPAKSDREIAIDHHLLDPKQIVAALTNFRSKLIFSNQEIQTNEIESVYLGKEYLKIALDNASPLIKKSSLTFQDLSGLSFLVFQDIGLWKKVIEDNIAGANFLYQNSLGTLETISQSSTFPYFVSNLSEKLPSTKERMKKDGSKRTILEIMDPQNELEIYASYLISEKKAVWPLIKELSKNWPK